MDVAGCRREQVSGTARSGCETCLLRPWGQKNVLHAQAAKMSKTSQLIPDGLPRKGDNTPLFQKRVGRDRLRSFPPLRLASVKSASVMRKETSGGPDSGSGGALTEEAPSSVSNAALPKNAQVREALPLMQLPGSGLRVCGCYSIHAAVLCTP